jgi:hypothetical protein
MPAFSRLALITIAAALLAALLIFPAFAQEATPFPPVDLGGVASIPQSLTAQGYPVLGSLDAPVQMIVFCGYDALQCGQFHTDVFLPLLPQIQAGEIQLVFVPLAGAPDLPNGRAAASSAICAARQGAFWTLSSTLYGWQAQGEAAFTADRLRAAAVSTGLNQTEWDACMFSDTPAIVIERGNLDARVQSGFVDASRPYVLVNGVPSLPDAESVLASVAEELAQAFATPDPNAPEATEPPIVVTLQPLLGDSVEPPITFSLPPGWQLGFDTLLLNDVDAPVRAIPLAVYSGPVPGGTGTIVLLWGFPSLVAGNPFQSQTVQPDLWSDGLRLLRLAILEQGCNIGTDLRREYTVGGRAAVGTQFSAVDCPELPDTRGWFAGVSEGGLNFVFYVFADPIEAMNSAEPYLQSVLDGVEFHVPQIVTATPQP